MKTPLFDIDNWKEIGATLARNKTRTFLTGFGIFWGVAMLALLLGGARLTTELLSRNFEGFSSNSGAIIAGTTGIPYKGHAKGRSWSLDLTDVERLRQSFPELRAVVPIFQSWDNVSCTNGSYSYSGSALGAVPEYVEICTPLMYSGRFINAADESQERKVAVLGKKIANEIFPDTPDPVGLQVELNGIPYSIVGVAGNLGEASINGKMDEKVLIPSTTFRKAFARADRVDFITFVGRDGVRLRDILPRMRSLIFRRHGIHPDDESAAWTIDISEQFEKIDMVFSGLNLLALFIGVSTLLAGIIGVGNIMWVIVKERTQEIGVRRAIGAKPRDIVTQVLCEGMALTVVAGTAGICFAALVLGVAGLVLSAERPTDVQMSIGLAMGIMTTFVVLGTLAGLIPAAKAMKIKPVEALNSK
ncbi:MAG: ABC transporter permease [Muribaculaceae bacterium]|nr:ABC transporter permease [Muribaculaceae bacterium]